MNNLHKIWLMGASILVLPFFLISCEDDMDILVPMPTNYTFNELTPGKFTHVINDGGFTYKDIKFNAVKQDNQLAAGFCYSTRSYRNFTWTGTEQAIDSVRYSVWTTRPNDTETYLVCNACNDNAFFTINSPKTIDYILISNTSWNYLNINYGSPYGTEKSPIANPNVPNAPKGVWQTYLADTFKKFDTGDYLKIVAKGFRGGQITGTVEAYLACIEADKTTPTLNFKINNWRKMELSALGDVDKVVFSMESSRDNLPHWFCMDGLQFKD